MENAAVRRAPSAANPPEIVTRANGPRFRSPFAMLAVFRSDPLGFLESCQREYGDVVEIRFWPFRTYFFTRPEHIKHILQEKGCRGFGSRRCARGDHVPPRRRRRATTRAKVP